MKFLTAFVKMILKCLMWLWWFIVVRREQLSVLLFGLCIVSFGSAVFDGRNIMLGSLLAGTFFVFGMVSTKGGKL
jgi:hypothetical protein